MEELLQTFVNAVKDGNWLLVAVFVNLAVVWVAQRFGKNLWSWLGTGLGKITLSFVFAVLGGLASALVTGSDVTLSLVVNLLTVAAGSSGLYSWLKKWLESRGDA